MGILENIHDLDVSINAKAIIENEITHIISKLYTLKEISDETAVSEGINSCRNDLLQIRALFQRINSTGDTACKN